MIKYLIQNVDRKEDYWGGNGLFGPFKLPVVEWKIPNYNHYIPSTDGISFSFYNQPVNPYLFNSLEEAKQAMDYVPRKFNVKIVSVTINFVVVEE